jgi:Fe(3+) dicitrate transport protein
MIRMISLLFITTLMISSALAQSATIQGRIFLSDSTTTLSGISVYIDNTGHGDATNGSGYFTIQGVPPGKQTLVVSGIGFITIRKDIAVAGNEVVEAVFVMEESVSSLAGVTVMARGNAGLRDIPGSVHYISPKEIEQFSYTDINRTLRMVPGINLQEEDGFGLRPNIGLRGTGVERSSKITVMEDGVLMAPAPYAAPAAYYFPTIGRMQGVEILKGSSQIKYGPYTTGGAINFISTQIPNEFGGKISLFGGSFGGRNLHAFVGNAHKNIGYLVETFQYGSDGFKQLDGGGDTGFDKQDYLAKFRINTNPDAKTNQSLTFKAGQTSETSNETYLGLTQEDFNESPYRRYPGSQVDQMNTEQSQFSLIHEIELSEVLNISTSVYRTNFKRNWYKVDKVKDSSGTKTSITDILDEPVENNEAYQILKGNTSTFADALEVKANNRSYYAQGAQTVLHFDFDSKKAHHDLSVGLRYHRDQIDRFQWVDAYAMDNGVMKLSIAGTPGTESNLIETADAFASYVQYAIRFSHFTFTPGVRYEHISLSRMDYGKNDSDRTGADLSERTNRVDALIPGIGIDYRFNKNLSTFIGIHKGFAPPGSKENTDPEESINYELGVRYAKNALIGQAVIYFNDYRNLLGADLSAAGGGGTGDLFNGGKAQAKGIEFQLGYDLLSARTQSDFSLPVSVVYTYSDAVFLNDFDSEFEGWGGVHAGDHFPYLAKHQVALLLGLEHRLFSINLSGRYSSAMRTSPGQGDIPVNEGTDAYFVIDVSATYVLHKNISLFANATNITDQVYNVARRPAGLRPGMPGAFNIGIKATF